MPRVGPAAASQGAAIQGNLRTELERALSVGDRASNAILREQEGRWSVQGDPTEGALLVAARKAGLADAALSGRFARVREIPFSSERKLMTTIHTDTQKSEILRAFTKGAPRYRWRASRPLRCARRFSPAARASGPRPIGLFTEQFMAWLYASSVASAPETVVRAAKLKQDRWRERWPRGPHRAVGRDVRGGRPKDRCPYYVQSVWRSYDVDGDAC